MQLTHVDLLKRACELAGGQSAMAAKLTERFPDAPVSPARIFNWIKRDSDIPPEYIAAIEKIVDGQVTRQQFRPNDFQEIWPDLAGQQAKDAKAKPKTPARQEA